MIPHGYSKISIIFTVMKKSLSGIAAILGGISLLFSSCASMEARKPVLNNTKWVCVKEMFVADAGTSTDTYTIEFTSARECNYVMSWYLPAHPAMYMNQDGKVDTIPARSSEDVSKCTWTYRQGKLTIRFEDGSRKEYVYKDGKLIGADKYVDGSDMVFEKSAD